MSDPVIGQKRTLISPGEQLFSISPDDTSALTYDTRAIYVGGEGDVEIKGIGDSTSVVFSSVPAGTILPIRARYVRANSTTATNLVGIV